MIDLHRDGPVFVLAMNASENRFEPEFLAAFESALDEVERAPAPAALVTSGAGKFYSNGLDVAWMMANGPAVAGDMIQRTLAVIGRVLTLPVFTVAAVNGHAFGAGAQLAVAHDLRLMRTGRGSRRRPCTRRSRPGGASAARTRPPPESWIVPSARTFSCRRRSTRRRRWRGRRTPSWRV
jgi:hypothetical protein